MHFQRQRQDLPSSLKQIMAFVCCYKHFSFHSESKLKEQQIVARNISYHSFLSKHQSQLSRQNLDMKTNKEYPIIDGCVNN